MALTKSELHVAKIIDEYKVVLNVGKVDGAEIGMRFLIYSLGEEITDPSNGQFLGTLEIVKGKVLVTHLQEKMCTAEAVKKTRVETVRTRPSIRGFLSELTPEQITETESAIQDPLDDVKVGDFVRRLS